MSDIILDRIKEILTQPIISSVSKIMKIKRLIDTHIEKEKEQ